MSAPFCAPSRRFLRHDMTLVLHAPRVPHVRDVAALDVVSVRRPLRNRSPTDVSSNETRNTANNRCQISTRMLSSAADENGFQNARGCPVPTPRATSSMRRQQYSAPSPVRMFAHRPMSWLMRFINTRAFDRCNDQNPADARGCVSRFSHIALSTSALVRARRWRRSHLRPRRDPTISRA